MLFMWQERIVTERLYSRAHLQSFNQENVLFLYLLVYSLQVINYCNDIAHVPLKRLLNVDQVCSTLIGGRGVIISNVKRTGIKNKQFEHPTVSLKIIVNHC